jgi:dinuclear metal center YbgI/SA1388 family protein
MKAEFIIKEMEAFAPVSTAEDWDNVGLLVGDASQSVKKILVTLDVTESVIDEAISGGFDFIISHHPLVYNPMKKITTEDSVGRKIIALIKNGIGCFCAHTNLDKAQGGVNDCLAEKIGLENLSSLAPEESNKGIGRVGFLREEKIFSLFAEGVKNKLNLPSVRICGDEKKLVKKIGLCGGSGERYIDAAIKQGCDAFVTGDLRYHAVQDALESGIVLLDITHYSGEILVLDAIISRFKNHVEIFSSSIDGQVFSTL